jgi:hypothetical protein
MKSASLFFVLVMVLTGFTPNEKTRKIVYQGKEVATTYGVDGRFLGTYKGRRSGYLKLNADGTGEFRYDIFGPGLQGCKQETITIEWGFLIETNGSLVKFKREYGNSYPILYKSVSSSSFKGCREEVMLDFIMEYPDKTLAISSSDDWKKTFTP